MRIRLQVKGSGGDPLMKPPASVWLSVMKYMDRLFEVIFSSVYQSQSLPAPIKFLFDFLDDRAIKLGVQDSRIDSHRPCTWSGVLSPTDEHLISMVSLQNLGYRYHILKIPYLCIAYQTLLHSYSYPFCLL
ncbi:unnamed protein product [Trichobilharzia regenti]|nr:unnamed protein product [Trichobilharzia regenti]